MNSLLEILGASVIGSLVILALITSLFTASDANFSLERELTVQKFTSVVADIIDADLGKCGLGVGDSTSAIVTADSTQLLFLTDIDGNDTIDSVHYYIQPGTDVHGNAITVLKRRVSADAGDGASLGTITIHFTFFDAAGNETAEAGSIKSVETRLMLRDYIENNGEYAHGFIQWRRHLKNIKNV